MTTFDVAACAPWSAIVPAGKTLQIIDLFGNQAVDTLFYGVTAGRPTRHCATTRRPPLPRNAISSCPPVRCYAPPTAPR